MSSQGRGHRRPYNKERKSPLGEEASVSSQGRWIPKVQNTSSKEAIEMIDREENDDDFPEGVSQKGSSLSRVTFAQARFRATFYPKFENEKSDQEVRMTMIEVVQSGKGVLEVSLKHSGSLFMYSGDGSAFAKNSFGNLYTAVGVFVLGRTLQEAWGAQASQKQKEFNAYLEASRLCISMELVTAVLGDHGQRPKQDYVVVTAVTDLRSKPRFYSTPDLMAFCREWRLPTNHVWLFSSRKSVTSFFTAYDALCEEGTASSVSKILDEISDISVPATKSHVEVQGEILEGLVARIITTASTVSLQKVLEKHPMVTSQDSCQIRTEKSLREIFSECGASEAERILALLRNVGGDMCSDWSDWQFKQSNTSFLTKFFKATPVDEMTKKFQEMLHFLQDRRMQVRYPAYMKSYDSNEQKALYKMTVHVLKDFVFRKYENEMRRNPELWPLYRGFFVDIHLFYGHQNEASMKVLLEKLQNGLPMVGKSQHSNGLSDESTVLADEAKNLMVKLKFLPYKIRTFLIRNGLSTLFQSGFQKYRQYYLRQMEIWNTSAEKQQHLDQLLTEWAQYITSKHRGKGLKDMDYLSEAEPFLSQYAKRNLRNQYLLGCAGAVFAQEDSLSRSANDVAEQEAPAVTSASTDQRASEDLKGKGMIVFFPGIPGCGKSAICRELLKEPGGLSEGWTMHTLMGDLVKGKYWPRLAQERQKRPQTSITLADKNAPNVEVWNTIESMCRSTYAVGVPVVPDSEGTQTNPFSLEVLALFMYRVVQRENHPGSLDRNSANAGYVLLMFYNLYEGKDRVEFEEELKSRFGCLVKLPVLKKDRPCIPASVLDIIKEGLDVFWRHQERHGKLDSSRGAFQKDWRKFEKELRHVLNGNATYFEAAQVSFEEAVQSLREQLITIARGEEPFHPLTGEERSFRNITYAAITIPGKDITDILQMQAAAYPEIENYFVKRVAIIKGDAHVTLAHKHAHGVSAVAAFGEVRGVSVAIELTALLFSSKMCALEAQIPENEKGIKSRNDWPHITVWTAHGVRAKEANSLPQLVLEGHASRVQFEKPVLIWGVVELL